MKKGKPGRPPVAKSIKEFLSSPATKKLFEEGKAQVQEGGGGFAEYDDGKYRGQVVSATMGRSQASGRWQHVMGFKFLEGEYKGQTYYQYQGLENPMGFTVLLAQFAKLGIEIEDESELEGADKQVVKEKPVVEFRLRTKGEFQNLLVLKAVDADEAEEEADEDVDTDTDEEDEDVEDTEDETDEEETPEPKKEKKSKPSDDEDEEDEDKDEDSDDEDEESEDEEDEDSEEEDEEEKPKKKSSKKAEPEEDEEKKDDEEKVTLDVGTKVKIKYEDESVVGKIVKVDEEKSRIKVKLKSGDKVWVSVPDDVEDVL